jgi:hypothetical protein
MRHVGQATNNGGETINLNYEIFNSSVFDYSDILHSETPDNP